MSLKWVMEAVSSCSSAAMFAFLVRRIEILLAHEDPVDSTSQTAIAGAGDSKKSDAELLQVPRIWLRRTANARADCAVTITRRAVDK